MKPGDFVGGQAKVLRQHFVRIGAKSRRGRGRCRFLSGDPRERTGHRIFQPARLRDGGEHGIATNEADIVLDGLAKALVGFPAYAVLIKAGSDLLQRQPSRHGLDDGEQPVAMGVSQAFIMLETRSKFGLKRCNLALDGKRRKQP